jgi:peptidoglycan/LPS O-acetylase OafA/YrhL
LAPTHQDQGRQESNAPRLASLDAVRGISALVVFFGHAGDLWLRGARGSEWLAEALQQSARYAVIVFFCLSGFAVAMSLHDNMQRGFSISRYAMARVTRVVPPLVVVLALVWLISAATNIYGNELGFRPFGARQQYEMWLIPALGALGMIPIGINSPLWSLQYEIQLYAIAGLGTWLFVTKDSTHRLVAMVLMVAFLFSTGMAPPNKFHLDARAPYFAAFAFGALGYVGRHISNAVLVVAGILATVGVVLLTMFGASATGAALGTLPWRVTIVVAAIVATAVVVALSRRDTHTPLRSLGSWSYTLYIIHYPLLLLVAGLAEASSNLHAVWLVGAPAALLIAYVLGRLVERPHQQRTWLRAVFACAQSGA